VYCSITALGIRPRAFTGMPFADAQARIAEDWFALVAGERRAERVPADALTLRAWVTHFAKSVRRAFAFFLFKSIWYETPSTANAMVSLALVPSKSSNTCSMVSTLRATLYLSEGVGLYRLANFSPGWFDPTHRLTEDDHIPSMIRMCYLMSRASFWDVRITYPLSVNFSRSLALGCEFWVDRARCPL
jgi:hypothetical protein